VRAVRFLAVLLALGGCSEPAAPPAPSLTIGVLAAPAGIDPARFDDPATSAIAKDVFETLVRVQPGSFTVVPGIASSWSTSADGTAWTLHLRGKLLFSDGTALDAAAVKLNLDRWHSAKDPNRGDGPYPAFAAKFGGFDDQSAIVTIDAPSPDTVVIHTREPFAPLLRDLALPAFGIGSPKAIEWSIPAFDQAPVGSGAYMIDDVAQGDHVALVRNPFWMEGAPAFASSTVRFIPDPPTARLALDKRDIDAILDPTAAVLPDIISRHPRFVTGPRDTIAYLAFDVTRPPFNDVRLRRAVADALDANAVARVAGMGATPAYELLPPGMIGADSALTPARPNVEGAKGLLRGANIPGSIVLYYAATPPPEMPGQTAVVNEIRAELSQAGINAVPQPMGPAVVLPAPGVDGALGLIVTVAASGEPDDIFGPIASEWNDLNFHNLLAAGRREFDDSTRGRTYRRMEAMIRDDVVAVPLAYPVATSAVAPGLDLDAYPMFAGYR
jgi:peptide/nickel transport system substrate-binding protein